MAIPFALCSETRDSSEQPPFLMSDPGRRVYECSTSIAVETVEFELNCLSRILKVRERKMTKSGEKCWGWGGMAAMIVQL